MPEVTARGLRFHVQECGTGPPVVVFVHGLAIDNLSSFYYTLASPVAEVGARCVLYDLRGHGLTERTPTGYGVSDAVADLFAVLDALGHYRVHLVGYSFGGAVALNAALAHPGRVAGLVLIDAHGPGDGPGWNEDFLNRLAQSALKLEHERIADQLLAFGERRMSRVAATADALLNRTTLLDDLAAMDPVRPAQLTTLSCPVLAVYGQHSDVADAGRLILRHVPDCALHTMAGHTHFVLPAGTAEILEVLLPWLAHHAGTRVPAAGAAR
ncbi:alpha/beta hydrolase [Actinomadura soli]|uniref:Alpha/beta hydrolase n=1 Tax=Actinomadura soli TaxID=2508997 RepID=A0A5C4J5I2_9ACTN|nr:alpha/beta hydrolase [Actinomadura soli]TMQ92254.1 alpha/beta hydrolase [Actinomadura soli]